MLTYLLGLNKTHVIITLKLRPMPPRYVSTVWGAGRLRGIQGGPICILWWRE